MTTRKELSEDRLNLTNLYYKIYPEKIIDAINRTSIYRNDSTFRDQLSEFPKKPAKSLQFNLMPLSLNAGIRTLAQDPNINQRQTAILNPASYKNPAAGFFTGLHTIETNLCDESYLYNILYAFNSTYYATNRRKMNSHLYTAAALYSRNVDFYLFEPDENTPTAAFNIISCSPPNFKKAIPAKNFKVSKKIINVRINFIRKICELNQITTLIMPLWGHIYYNIYIYELCYSLVRYFYKSSTVKQIYICEPNLIDYKGLVDRMKQEYNAAKRANIRRFNLNEIK